MKDITNVGALRGIKVIDLSRVLGGPYCTQILGDHGADVIKVEPAGGDETRMWGPPFFDDSSAYFEGINRNKRSITLDLNSERDQSILFDLLNQSDVLVQNFRPQTLRRWCLHPTDLESRLPRLVHCWVTGFGEGGPYGGLPGYDAVIQGLCGLMSVNGEQDGGPLRIGIPIVDLVTGLNAALGIMLALREREMTGQGQTIECALYDSGLSLLHPYVANYLRSGAIPQPAGNAHPNITPYDQFQAKDGAIYLAVGNDGQFRALCHAIGAQALAEDPRFRSNELRTRNRAELRNLLAGILSALDVQTICELMTEAGVPCGAINDIKQALDHPHTLYRDMIIEMGDYRGMASPIKMSQSKPTYRRRPPHVGEHNSEILSCYATKQEPRGS